MGKEGKNTRKVKENIVRQKKLTKQSNMRQKSLQKGGDVGKIRGVRKEKL